MSLLKSETFASFDYTRLFQALLNIVGNAIKFTASGGKVSLRYINGDSNNLKIEIKDTGIGIEKKFISLIFQRFWQGQTSVKEKGSAGLGLSIAKGIIDAHGGKLDVSSIPNKGTVFTITIPHEENEKSSERTLSTSTQNGSRNVLLVEDDLDLKEIFTELLTNEGFNVTGYSDGNKAFEYVSESNDGIDLIILDYQLPGINGSELVSKIRLLPKKVSQVPILVTSAEMNLAEVFPDNTNLSFVKKPVAINDFMNAVENAIVNKG